MAKAHAHPGQLPHLLAQFEPRIQHARVVEDAAMEAHEPTGPPQRHSVVVAEVRDHGALQRGPGQIFELMSCSIALSRLSSATSFFNRAFSPAAASVRAPRRTAGPSRPCSTGRTSAPRSRPAASRRRRSSRARPASERPRFARPKNASSSRQTPRRPCGSVCRKLTLGSVRESNSRSLGNPVSSLVFRRSVELALSRFGTRGGPTRRSERVPTRPTTHGACTPPSRLPLAV